MNLHILGTPGITEGHAQAIYVYVHKSCPQKLYSVATKAGSGGAAPVVTIPQAGC